MRDRTFYVIPSDSAGMVIVAESGHSVPLVTPE